MEVFESIRTVLAVRQFKSDPIPEATLHQIVEAGRLTASSMNGQPWHFIVIQDPATLQQLGTLLKTGPYVAQAPAAIAVVTLPSPYAVSDGSRAIQSMVLTAWAAGIGSNWVGFSGMMAEVKPFLGIPDEMDILAFLPFGYPAREIGQGKKERKPLGEVASQERFGQPYK